MSLQVMHGSSKDDAHHYTILHPTPNQREAVPLNCNKQDWVIYVFKH